ncbi:protein involved in polysaccharide export, contains SLBB domain of the beta-grasp fold [Spirosomataceae bacterium TFI 002]|nr:protein involved in polysaccharide export, contains SLBB domain of the beta-grasp fold [Spirosomataceae bacterium TFI 002]
MKFVKVRNSIRITKAIAVLVILFSFNSEVIGQIIPQVPQNLPAGNQNLPTGTQIPGNGIPTQNGTQQQPRTQNRVPQANDPTNARNVGITPLDEQAITREDSVRLVIEAREDEDLQLTAIRRRIFGYRFFNQVLLDPNAAINIATPNNYVLGANDQLILDYIGFGAEHQELTVSPDGNITEKRTGIIKVGGLTISEAKSKIFNALSKTIYGLKGINLSLGNVRTIKVNIIGEVIAPGTYTMTSFSTIVNAMYACGGPNEIGTFREIQLIRNNKVAATLDLYDIIINGKSDFNLLLQDQDVIQVSPIISRVAVSGLLKRKGLFELKTDEVLQDAIKFAGGFDKDAYKHRIKVYRNTDREKRILDVLNTDFKTQVINDGDSIVVDRILDRFENLVTVEGAVFRAGEFSLDSNPTITKLINSAEGLREDALIGRVSVIRTNDDLTLENFSINLKDIKSGIASDFQLKRQDVLVVPSVFDLTEDATIRISGAINNPAAIEGVEIPFMKNLTLEDILVRVGGLTEAASLNRVEIVRRKRNVDQTVTNAQIADIIVVDISPDFNVLKGDKNPVLMPYDEIFVRSSPNYQEQSFVEIQGEIFYPSIYGINTKEERISDLIERAGGLTPQAYIEGATLIRTVVLSDVELRMKQRALEDIAASGTAGQIIEVDAVEPTQQQSIGINLKKILQNPKGLEDIMLKDGDVIKIPQLLETIRIQGEVLYPNTVKYFKGSSFKDYVSEAGGFTRRSLKGRSYVLYANGSVDRTRKFLMFNIYPNVKPGSEIIVPQRAENTAEALNRTSGIIQTLSATIGALVGIYGLVQLNK